KQETPHRVQRALAALRRVQGLPLRVLHGDVQERQERWQGRQQRPLERHDPLERPEPAADLLPNFPRVVARLDLEIRLEQIDDRQIRSRFTVRDGSTLEDEPPAPGPRTSELEEQARFPDPGFPDDRDDLAVTLRGLFPRRPTLLDLGIAADEARQPPPGRSLQTSPRLAGPRHLVDLHGVSEALYWHGAKRFHLDVALGQRQGLGGDHNRAGIGELFHTGGQMRRLADGRVVHVQIAADGAGYRLARVEPDADLDHDRVRASHLFRVRLHGFLHPERRVPTA